MVNEFGCVSGTCEKCSFLNSVLWLGRTVDYEKPQRVETAVSWLFNFLAVDHQYAMCFVRQVRERLNFEIAMLSQCR